jgi:BRCA1-associated protein
MSQSTSADGASGGGLATRARFIPADPKNTDIGYGVVHLYRDVEETAGLYDDGSYASKTAGSVDGTLEEEDCSTLCILAVPSYMMPSDLLGWAGSQAHEDVSHFRLIRTSKANRYMVLMKFREPQKARQWLKEYNGRAFSSMEPEYAHVVFVQSITFQEGGGVKEHPASFPDMSDDPFIPKSQPSIKTAAPTGSGEPALAAALSTRPLAPPPPNLVELPTCPVCLERMDETTGLLTILCQHVFHCDCLSKWRGSGCPVCRYTQNGPVTGTSRTPAAQTDTENACSVCSSDQNLWICLICGNVGCGRYDSAHAFAHFEETGHAYAMDIATQHVWDYVGDGYVHRLIQNKADGKMVDLPEAYGKRTDGGMSAVGADMVPREKMDAMGNEYAYLLQSQLENQRSYFEDQLDRALEKASKAANAAEKATAALDDITTAFEKLQSQNAEMQTSIKTLERDLTRSTTKASKTDALAKQLAKDWKEEKTVNEGLLSRLKVLDAKLAAKDGEVDALRQEKAELEEQNRDLSFFISGGDKLRELKEAGEDVEGTVEVGSSSKGKRKGRKK